MKRVAIIGAGLSGIILAKKLSKKSEVVVFEKAKGLGGRMSTRYADPFAFDHGAQCFTARTKEFQTFLKPFIKSGIVAEWKGKVINLEIGKKPTKRLWYEPHLVASPNMNSLCKELAIGLNIQTHHEIACIKTRKEGKWELNTKDGDNLGYYDWVISTLPPEQTIYLFATYIDKNEPIHSTTMQSCYSLMVGFNKLWNDEWIAAKVRNSPIKWISVNSTKPRRNDRVTCFVIHSKANWAKQYIDSDIKVIEELLLKEFSNVTGLDIKNADYISTHRWLYSIVENTNKSGSYLNLDLGLAATGDFCETSRIEEVWFHAEKLGNLICRSQDLI